MTKNYDFIIVGQGIAGTVLAHTLLNEGKSVIVIDDPALSNASKIAAGLYNPVVFKRLVKSWMADDLIPFMIEFYQNAERIVDTHFFHNKQIVKLFTEENEKEFWIKKTNEDVGKYLSKTIHDNFLNDIIYCPLGASEVLSAGNLNSSLFLSSFQNYFNEKGILVLEKFEYDKLAILETSVTYKNISANKIIFCEGYKAIENPYFNWLPFKLTKGEIITIKLLDGFKIPTEKVINKGVFVLPVGDNKYRIGATYEWNELDERITEKGKTDLTEKLKKILKVPFEVIEHNAGVRPTVNDRRPLIGTHPQHKALGVFNGMGTKAVMIAPYFAKQFVDFLKRSVPLDKEVDIDRFK